MEKVLILDFGGQYNQLIARRVRECGVYCEVHSHKKMDLAAIRAYAPDGIILTGGPNSVYGENAPRIPLAVFEMGIPVLGICYGCQLMAHTLGGVVMEAGGDDAREYGRTVTSLDNSDILFSDLPAESITWMSHGDYISQVPVGFHVTARTAACPTAAMAYPERRLYGVQFHPEVRHTERGKDILRHFLMDVCALRGDWSMGDFCQRTVAELRQTIGSSGRVLLGLSGGVDSSVLAALLAEAIGDRLTCVFVDHGMMRKNEGDEVEAAFQDRNVNFVRVNAAERFLSKLRGVTDPQEKRQIIGAEFGYVFLDEAMRFGITNADFFAQGTIYPDVIESGDGDADVIKSHHNRLLPKEVVAQFKGVLEPLSLLFKDEVRQLGRVLGLPEALVSRQPFPGPGLAVRIIGEITQEKADLLREADAIFRTALEKAGLGSQISQYFAVLTNTRCVGVMGDGRTYDNLLVLRAVTTDDFMTAKWARIPYDLLDQISGEIINRVRGINRVAYDITTKPPATIEFE